MSGGSDFPEPDLRETRTRAMDLLARREHSCLELERKLLQKGFHERCVRQVIEQLRDENLLSDTRYAEALVRSRVQRQQGPLKIRAALRQAGIEDSLVEAALENEAEHWQDTVNAWVDRRGRPGMDRKEKARLYRGGVGRGFTHEQVMAALDRLNSED